MEDLIAAQWLSEEGRQAALRAVRAKGLIWIANQQGHFQQGMASLAGRDFTVSFTQPWTASVLATTVDRTVAAQKLRETEVQMQIKAALEECGFQFEMVGSEFYIGETQQIRCSVTKTDSQVNVLWE